jgi:hypothetical protein
MVSTSQYPLLTFGLVAVALTACTTPSDNTASASSAFATPGTGQKFLLGFYEGDFRKAEPYNGQVFQDTGPAYPDDLASPKSLKDWKAKFMPSTEPVVQSFYRNVRELGGGPGHYFWRRMTCTKRFVRGGPGGCVVVNYLDENANGGRVAADDDNDGTVGMSLTRDGFVHFALYEPYVNESGIAEPDSVESTTLAQLDDENTKTAPHVCVNCHGGAIAEGQDLLQKPDLGSVFREFEPSLLQAAPGVSQADAEQQWYDLNQAALAANAALRGESEGAIAGLEHTRAAVGDHIRALYDGLGAPSSHPDPPFSRAVGAPELVPPSWRAQDQSTQTMWSSLVNPYCMQCHRHNKTDFSDFGNFSSLRNERGGQSRLQQYLVDDGREDRGLPYMPQAQGSFETLQSDIAAWAAIRQWSGKPPSEAVVQITADQPGWPNQIQVSGNTFTATAPGAMALRFVNNSSHDVYVCFRLGDECPNPQKLAPFAPPVPPSELQLPISFRGARSQGFPESIPIDVYNTDTPDHSIRSIRITVTRGF